MKQEDQPKDLRLYTGSAKPDIEKELLGSSNNGNYVDALNFRTHDISGNSESANKIKGEGVVHNQNPVIGTYECICSTFVNENKFEVHVDTFGILDPIIKINGVVMVKSVLLPFNINHQIQADVNNECNGGEVFLTDHNSTPMIFNVGDIMSSMTSDPDKYFSNFNPDLYYVNLTSPLDIPVFVSLENVGGGGGLPVGSHQYALRYVTKAGDRTNRGHLTPPIPVVERLSQASSTHPWSKTTGAKANESFPSSYGIRLRFRVTNISNYDSIEIIRISNTIEGGPEYTPETKVVARIPISPQEVSVREYLDPVSSNVSEVVTDTEDAGQLSYIKKAKALRYYDNRLWLMNVEFASRETDLHFDTINGQPGVPIMKSMGNAGHADPYNYTYYKSYMSSEKEGFGVQVYDPVGGKAFVQDVPGMTNFKFPSRREVASADSILLSDGMVEAADVNGGVSKTFEVFDHYDNIGKSDTCSFKNILKKGDKSNSDVTSLCSSDPEDVGAKVNILNRVKAPYRPYGPTDENDITDSHKYLVNYKVHNGSSWVDYNPKGFGTKYYAKGVALPGISNFPDYAKSFSIVKKKTAGRVIAQGIGTYSLNPGDFGFLSAKALCSKRTNKLFFFSPDFYSNIKSVDVVNDIMANPQNYKIQFVSPLGFFSEIYNFEADGTNDRRDRVVDMITYARVLKDSGLINPGESGVGVLDYVAFNKYRNSHAVNGGIFSINGTTGLYDFSNVRSINEGRGSYLEIELPNNVYNTYGVGGTSGSEFSDSELKDWTEPFYIINIIQDGKNTEDNNVNEYQSTGHYQKLESIIGIGDGTAKSLILVDERWEDCIPDIYGGSFMTRDSFVYIKKQNGQVETWINITYKTPADIATILNDISVNGFHVTTGGVTVTGVYTHHSSSDNRTHYVDLTYPGFFPQDKSQIIVKYDASMPIRVFGGDTFVGETIFAPIDREATGEDTDDQKDEQFVMNLGFPFRRFKINPRHYIVSDTTGANKIQNQDDASLGYIRQMVIMFCCESRICTPYAFNSGSSQFFPHTHYVMRPNRFDDTNISDYKQFAEDNNMFEQYFLDYPDEQNLFRYGGFRFKQVYNIDYSKESPIDHISKPKIGFEENTEFPTAVCPSLPRAVNSQDAPGLKTFLSSSVYYLQDKCGEIKFAYDARFEGKGDNIYAITESGLCLILTKKSVLSNLNADEISILNTDAVIQGEYWLSRQVGSNDQMWRSRADASVPIKNGEDEIRIDACFWANKESVFMLLNNSVTDIRSGYYSKLHPALIRVMPGYESRVVGHYDPKYDEYYLQLEIESDDDCCQFEDRTFVYSRRKQGWNGRYSYKFEKYMSDGVNSYGVKDRTTYILDSGFVINGSSIESFIDNVSSVNPEQDKEFIRARINTGNRNQKPQEVQFYDRDYNLVSKLDQASKGPLYLKWYGGWEQFIPRADYNYSYNRVRNQDRLLIYRIVHNLAEDFRVISTQIQFKIIK